MRGAGGWGGRGAGGSRVGEGFGAEVVQEEEGPSFKVRLPIVRRGRGEGRGGGC